ncbi:DUF4190 domain-containing protein [Streptomonospora litoralis]|uniref:DUF4190 domain-containing protein n=1 Tax=Streptomonospora litoralis TaxID=2498135 RepID=A0A4P6PW02_9ACTN|nr:DUF4190 domain-containing protein [Streptomonospora litoralis]QBI52416.1 hypothetical protein EKD16_03025 [Streptomonospora litoralis]
MTDEPPQPRSDGQQPTVERGGLWGLFLSAAGLVLQPYGIVLSALAVFQGRRARRSARANSSSAPGAVLSMTLGWAGVAVSGITIAVYAAFWPAFEQHAQCSVQALTHSTQETCDDALRQTLTGGGVPERALWFFVPAG